jgi:hypothetical protein
MAAPVNYSTRIEASKTVGEMQALLAAHGASRIAVDYDGGGPVALHFMLTTPHGQRSFALPVNVEAMERLLVREDRAGRLKSGSKADRTSRAQAERVAWRVMKDWLAAQLALVATQMVDLDEVFLPYLVVDQASGRSLYAVYKEREALALAPPSSGPDGG